jgi:TM2 domain/zinc-ribbon domain
MGTALARPTKYCHNCGAVIEILASTCAYCGAPQPSHPGLTEKRILPALLLAVTLGFTGAHRFYAGRPKTATAQLLTLGGAGLWWFADVIMLATGQFRDADGERITEWM